jgi:hypothetical protein
MIPDFMTCFTEVFSLRLTSSLPESVKLNFTKTKLTENIEYVKSQIESHIENIPFSLLFPSVRLIGRDKSEYKRFLDDFGEVSFCVLVSFPT